MGDAELQLLLEQLAAAPISKLMPGSFEAHGKLLERFRAAVHNDVSLAMLSNITSRVRDTGDVAAVLFMAAACADKLKVVLGAQSAQPAGEVVAEESIAAMDTNAVLRADLT